MPDDLVAWLRAVLDEDEAEHPAPDALPVSLIDAMRAILDLHRLEADYDGSVTEGMGIPPNCTTCHEDLDTAGYEPSPLSWPCPTLRLLASAYRHRPDYREEWAPSV